ncbi:MAG TPA: CDP-diacylglycerol--glycerol-3-phosphate 3-phosphatidyltransferase [Opitutaceae bacterium]|jgi:CDP-diacylglycerol---glycerol-3-phosphate 3-phosphatidyltransferase|nr:CDP-diacylglycerol--glycerol-3-phosphate 3-phosphatidyltransferase [Opitutaceae bacterium]OQB96305.1 MAG: CDP-diacylglycerol--glycerol-3-phosphate 3-phosphatidyltransferase [Verrucomicrobia bacterium ADurb.Bin122]MBP8962150.1 CDP-diacylglycerol--glycerol-3-phosphate 3-phosphatidyltransferase [Opitutaceae bacterium]HOD46394.1 CDP-diacylglycerol--glycerol-3-phosphate 3-phosphatidyltransferase [Opitutaceae bacterium]HOF10031.1 CDP-diacylglycerol--glycerol-3-phosphate 3-phosphatidyltransferase [
MNLPNILTLSRVPAMFAIVALMYPRWTGAASIAFWLFIAGAVSDWLDGYLARKQGIVSDFGKLMDALTDKIMVIGIMVALVDRNYVPIALVLVTLCREFMVSGLRMLAAAKGVVVPADRGGKTKTLTQLISIGFLLGSTMARQDWAVWLPWRHWDTFADVVYSIGWVGFALSTLLAVWSGYRYFMKQRDLWSDC